jgi:UDP-N-acetylglucosamine 2-epimerase (non-hydrolysing)
MERNLLSEGIPQEAISRYGNPSLQALWLRMSNDHVPARQRVASPENIAAGMVTFHHDENLLDPMRLAWILDCIASVATTFSLTVVLYRRTQLQLERFGLFGRLKSMIVGSRSARLLTTLKYDEYVQELLQASFVLTDSSTIQDECAFLRKPCFVMRTASPRAGDLPSSTRLVNGLPPARLMQILRGVLQEELSLPPQPDLDRLGPVYDHSFVELLITLAQFKPKPVLG